jgi:hypothetical protein
MTRLNIEKYASYFHDGIVFDLEHENDKISFAVESAELRPEWNRDKLILSKRHTISGILHLEEVKSIKINDKPCHSELVKSYDDGNIYHLEIKGDILIIELSWENYPPKRREETDVFIIEIQAKKIYWENIPALFDKYWNFL